MDNQNAEGDGAGVRGNLEKLVFSCRNRHGRELGHKKQCQSEREDEENGLAGSQFEKTTNVRFLNNVHHARSAGNEEENGSLRGPNSNT